MRNLQYSLFLTLAAAVSVAAADATAARFDKAAAVFTKLSEHVIRPEQIASADCIAVIPGFKKGAAGVGVGFGRGFISCRRDGGWSAPGAIAFETASLGVQLGGEGVDIVVLSMDKGRRPKLLSDRFTIGSDASAAWGNGKSAHADPNAQILFFGATKGVFAGFGLDGATLKVDDSSNKTLYGKSVTNSEIVDGGTATPATGQGFIGKLAQVATR